MARVSFGVVLDEDSSSLGSDGAPVAELESYMERDRRA